MKMSQMFSTLREAPKEAEAVSERFLLRGRYIKKLAAGIHSFLPLGLTVQQNLVRIIDEEMEKIGGQKVLMPVLQPKNLWVESERWEKMDPPLFKITDRHDREYALGSTHEEIITDIIRQENITADQLPKMFYQIQTKFRNEMRATGGLLRIREFSMKDGYSFHADKKSLDEYYQKVVTAYFNIFKKLGLEAVKVEAHSGSIGGEESNEFMILAEAGEDKVQICQCGYAANSEIRNCHSDRPKGADLPANAAHQALQAEESLSKVRDPSAKPALSEAEWARDDSMDNCPKCGGTLETKSGIEIAHIFKLNELYSKKLNARFADDEGRPQFYQMGCYGIGVDRLIATIIEASHDEKGIIWPASVAPYDAQLIEIPNCHSDRGRHGDRAEESLSKVRDPSTSHYRDVGRDDSQTDGTKIYDELTNAGVKVLYDDRENVTAGAKFADADLLGMPWRIIVSEKSLEKGGVELKKRDSAESEIVAVEELVGKIK